MVSKEKTREQLIAEAEVMAKLNKELSKKQQEMATEIMALRRKIKEMSEKIEELSEDVKEAEQAGMTLQENCLKYLGEDALGIIMFKGKENHERFKAIEERIQNAKTPEEKQAAFAERIAFYDELDGMEDGEHNDRAEDAEGYELA